jgi:BASS family bile acid:Na+ symporter
MSVDQLINVLVTVTLIEMMVAIGLGVTLADLVGVARNARLIAQAALANYVGIPAVTVGLLLLFRAQPLVAAGFLILAVCPGAPYGPPLTAMAKGNVAVAVGLMAILAGSSALLAPILLHYLLLLVPGQAPLEIDTARIVGTLLVTQLLPLCVGVAVRRWRPTLADRLKKPANLVSKVLNLLAVGFILVARFNLLMEIGPRGWVGMLVLLIASWAVGWLLGGPGKDVRRAMTLTTSLRNVGVGLVIASTAFGGTGAVTATLAYGLFGVVGSLLLAVAWARRAPAAEVLAAPTRLQDCAMEPVGRDPESGRISPRRPIP